MERKLHITGKGKLSITPDIAIISFDAEAHELEYEKSVTALNNKVEELRFIIEKQGIDRKSLKTKDFSVRKETTWSKKTERHEFNGFRASHSMELEIPLQKEIINTLLRQIAGKLSNLDFSISFGVKDVAQHQQQLILQAISKAKENAKLIAEAAEVNLKEILNIDYSYHELTIRSQRHDYPIYEAEMMTTADATPDFEPDDIDVAETVTMTWRID